MILRLLLRILLRALFGREEPFDYVSRTAPATPPPVVLEMRVPHHLDAAALARAVRNIEREARS